MTTILLSNYFMNMHIKLLKNIRYVDLDINYVSQETTMTMEAAYDL